MELEELQIAWTELSRKVEKQEKFSHKMIEEMTQQKYTTQLNKVFYAEAASTPVCVIGAIALVWNFYRLNEPLMQIFCAIAILLMLILPILSLASLNTMKRVQLSAMTYKEAVRSYAGKKIRFQKLQQFNVVMGLLLMIVGCPVMFAMMDMDVTRVPYFFTVIAPAGIAAFLGFSIWVLRCYNGALNKAETLLREIEE